MSRMSDRLRVVARSGQGGVCTVATACALACFGLAFALAAPVEAHAAGTEDSALQQVAVQAYARDNAVPLAQAQLDVALADKAAPVLDSLDSAIGPTSGDIWFDPQDSGRLKIGVAAASPLRGPNIDAAKRLLAAHGLLGDADFVPVVASLTALEAAQASIDSVLGALERAGLVATSINPSINSVVVQPALGLPPSETVTVYGAAAAAGVPVRVEALGTPSASLQLQAGPACGSISISGFGSNLLACDPPLRGGVEINTDLIVCTAGFNGNRLVAGRPVFPAVITAGHCLIDNLNTLLIPRLPLGPWSSHTASGAQQLIGPQTIFFGPGDYGLIRNANAGYWKPTPYVYVDSSSKTTLDPTYVIHSDGRPRVGLPVCTTSGPVLLNGRHTDCGTVINLHRLHCEDTALGLYCRSDVETTITTTPDGSSGAPIFKAHIAYGTHVGIERPGSHHQFFAPIREAEVALNFRISTG